MASLRTFIRSWPLMAVGVLYLYLAYHALTGNQGLVKWAEYNQAITAKQSELAQLQAQRDKLEVKAALLRETALDADTLDLLAREHVHLTRPNEVVIWLEP